MLQQSPAPVTYSLTPDQEIKKPNNRVSDVFRAAEATQDALFKIVASLGFLENCFTLFASTGKSCDEYQTTGLVAIFRALSDLAECAVDGRNDEHRIIEAMAAGEV